MGPRRRGGVLVAIGTKPRSSRIAAVGEDRSGTTIAVADALAGGGGVDVDLARRDGALGVRRAGSGRPGVGVGGHGDGGGGEAGVDVGEEGGLPGEALELPDAEPDEDR